MPLGHPMMCSWRCQKPCVPNTCQIEVADGYGAGQGMFVGGL